ncbi:MAG: hypothetical protein JO189_08695, partial [Deltaproteobacteria bacterium]|nr:hypothetical protein [Deltaproteobacteria bacterium]
LASRIDRLGREEKELLQTLAVIGKEFPLSLIRKVVRSADDDLERMLSELQVAEFIYEQPAVSDLEYTFKHALTQEVAYGLLLNERRKELHRRIGAAIESLYSERLEDHYGELARHYSRAGESAKAVHYLGLAGEQAFARSAYAEAIANLATGLELLKTLSGSPARDRQEVRMQLTLASALFVVTGPASDEAAAAFSRAYELCRRGGESPDVVAALVGLSRVHLFRGAVHKAREVSQEAVEAAGRIQDPAIVATAHCSQGMVLHFLAELAEARERLEQAITLFNSISVPSSSMGRLISFLYLGRTLWLLGFPDQALERTRQTEIAGQESTDPVAKGFGLALTLEVYAWCGNFDVVREHVQMFLDAPWTAELNPGFHSDTDLFRGWLMTREGQPQGITLIRNAIATRAVFRLYRALYGSMLVEACASLGRIDDAMTAFDETLPFAETEEHYYEAELHRLRGELLLRRTVADRENGEQCFREAIDIARRQGAKSWELRATTSLARLLRDIGRRDEARAMLAELYGWFTEGFNTVDLKQAKALLDQLQTY